MIGVSRPREREQRDSHEAEVFKKCQACQTRPASIRCEDCLRDRHPDLMCYGCSRRVHSEQSHHAYEYATFRDMLLPEDERSLQESDCFPADNLFKLESKASKPYYEASIDPTTNEHSLVAAVDIYTPPTDSPAKKQYQTFGRRSDITLQAKQSDIGSKRVDKLHPTYDKENFKRNNQPSEENQSSNSGRKRGLAQPNLRSSKQLSQHQSAVDQYSIKASAEKQKYLRPAHESAQSREADYRKAKVPPRHDRQILREVTNYQVEDQSRHRDETGSLNVHKDRDARMLNSHSSKDRSGSRVEQRHESPNKSRDVQLVSTEPMSRGTPNKTPNKAAKEQRLLSGSSWKTRARPQSEQAHMLHSPAYLDSVTELHKTELDSLKTRHKVELDRLESELTNLAKNYDAEVKSLRSELRQTSEDASEVHHRVVLHKSRTMSLRELWRTSDCKMGFLRRKTSCSERAT